MVSKSSTLPRTSAPTGTPALAAWGPGLERAGFFLLLVALIWAPWPLGSNRPWAVALLAALVWCGVVLASVGRLGAKVEGGRRPRPAFWWGPLACLAGFVALVAAQQVSFPHGSALSIDPHATRLYLQRALLYLGAWLLVLLTVRTRERAGVFLGALLLAGLLQAIGAVLLYSSGANYDLWFAAFDQGSRAQGTFPSPDHMAGYMELTLSAGLGWLVSRLKGDEAGKTPHWRGRLVAVLAFVMSGKMLLRLLLVVLVIALVMSHSRMGNAAFFLSLFVVAGIVAWRSPRLRQPALWLVASMALVDLVIIGQWVGLDRVVQRMKDTAEASSPALASFGLETAAPPREESLSERLQVPMQSLKLVEQRPWFGHGGGAYYTAFPAIKQGRGPWHWDHAHNDYVQVACDTGLVGLFLWVAIGALTWGRAAQLLHDGESRANRGLGVAALMGLCCMAMHSMVDFNLHIPANALTFTVLLAAAWALPPVARSRRSGSRSPAVAA